MQSTMYPVRDPTRTLWGDKPVISWVLLGNPRVSDAWGDEVSWFRTRLHGESIQYDVSLFTDFSIDVGSLQERLCVVEVIDESVGSTTQSRHARRGMMDCGRDERGVKSKRCCESGAQHK